MSIRGASSIPTQVVVSNLARGTTMEDLRQVLLKCGDIIRVRERRIPNSTRGLTFEVLFEDRQGAVNAVKEFHGAYADHHLLEAVIEEEQRREPAAIVAAPVVAAPPTGPRASAANGNGNGVGAGAGAAGPRAPRSSRNAAAAAAPQADLGSRLLTRTERKALTKPGSPAVALPTGPRAGVLPKNAKNAKAAAAAVAATSLQSRLGGLPLAQRLGQVKGGTQNGAGSDLATLEASKSKKALKRQRQAATATAAAVGAATTTSTQAAPSRSKIQREKRKAKLAAAAATSAAANGGDTAMQLD